MLERYAPVAVIAVASKANALINRQLQDACQSHSGAAACIIMPAEDFKYATWMVDLPPVALASWNIPQFSISVITNNRPESLQRLLVSLEHGHYFGDRLGVDFSIESTASDETLVRVQEFVHSWGARGSVSAKYRVIKGGLIRAVTESYYPSTRHHHGILLEDDIEASISHWLADHLTRYQYGTAQDFAPHMYGVSLYTPRVNEIAPKRYPYDSDKVMVSASNLGTHHMPYLHQTPCSWGAVYFADTWKEYRAYLNARMADAHLNLQIRSAKTNGWSTSWKRYFIEMAYQSQYYMLYPNYSNQTSFSTNWLEPGEHIVGSKPRQRGDARHPAQYYIVPLMQDEEASMMWNELPQGGLPPLEDLPQLNVLDLFVDEVEAGSAPEPGSLWKLHSSTGEALP
ncbi:unnamed protein product [Chrysoparadoxa australica]